MEKANICFRVNVYIDKTIEKGELTVFMVNEKWQLLASLYRNKSNTLVQGYVIVIPWVVRLYVEIIHEL